MGRAVHGASWLGSVHLSLVSVRTGAGGAEAVELVVGDYDTVV